MNARNRVFMILGLLTVGSLIWYLLTARPPSELMLIGTVDANEVLVSAKIPGRIQDLAVEEGQQVQQGQLIAVVESKDLEAAREAAEATVSSDRFKLGETVETERQNQGEVTNATANAEAQVRVARASLAQAQANLDHQQADTTRTVQLAKQGIIANRPRTMPSPACRQIKQRCKRRRRTYPRPRPACARRTRMNCSRQPLRAPLPRRVDRFRTPKFTRRPGGCRARLRKGVCACYRQGQRAGGTAGRGVARRRNHRYRHGLDPDLGLRAAARNAG